MGWGKWDQNKLKNNIMGYCRGQTCFGGAPTSTLIYRTFDLRFSTEFGAPRRENLVQWWDPAPRLDFGHSWPLRDLLEAYTKMATSKPAPRGAMAGPQPSSQPDTPEALQRSPTPPDSQDGLPMADAEFTLPEVFHDGTSGDIRKLLRSLPTRADLKALAADLKDGFQKEMQQIRGEISSLHTKMTVQDK